MDCPACSFANPEGYKFCGECRSPIGASAEQVTEKERPLRDVRAYTPKHLADRILRSKSALEGERKRVTVLDGLRRELYADLGATGHAARLARDA